MDPVTIGLLVSAGVAIVGPLIAEAMSKGDREKAEALRQEAMKQYSIDLPAIDAIAVQPQIVESQAAKAQGSPEAQGMRMEALRQLSRRAGEGYTVEEQAAINQGLGEVAAQERGSREAILRKLPAGSGERTAALLSNQQAAAQQASQMGLDIAAQGRRKALEALSQKGQLAGAIDESTFGQQFQTGQAADAIAKFNELNRLQSGSDYEANRLRQANRAQDLKWQQAQQRAAALGGLSQNREAEAQRIRQGVGGTAQGVSTAAGAYASQQAYEQDPYVRLRKKKQEEELKKLGSTGTY